MDLNEEQKAKVAAWFAAGESLDEIQKHIKSEFGVHVTYLDLRLMVAELPQPQDAEDEKDEGGERGSGGMGAPGRQVSPRQPRRPVIPVVRRRKRAKTALRCLRLP